MKSIFKRQNDVTIEIFKNWEEMKREDLRREIKKQKTDFLKEILKYFEAGMLIGLGAIIIGIILSELAERD